MGKAKKQLRELDLRSVQRIRFFHMSGSTPKNHLRCESCQIFQKESHAIEKAAIYFPHMAGLQQQEK
jgi:hypothetical protein